MPASKPRCKLALCAILHDDDAFLTSALASFGCVAPAFCFVSRVPWHDQPGDWEAAAETARNAGAQVVLGDWPSELEHRKAAQEWLLEKGFTHALIPDGDEIVEPELLKSLVAIAENDLADRVYVEWDTYWRSPEYVIRPREGFRPCLLVDLRRVTPVGGRNFEGGRPLFLSAEHGIVHHLSYAGPDERIRRKISTWGHRDEVLPGWYENVWLAWDSDKTLRNLHPTHPEAYGFAERIQSPDILRPAMERHYELIGVDAERGEDEHCSAVARTDAIASPLNFRHPSIRDRVDIIIPVHGGAEDLRRCLKSLEPDCDLLGSVVVIDNASPDHAVEVTESFPFVRVIRNETNTGFAHACNQGLRATDPATADIHSPFVLFLNSDTIVPPAGLERLMESLASSGSIAAAGPYTNRCGHGQQIDPTYTSLGTLDLFAEDFAARCVEDVETDMLVGFCLAMKRDVLHEIGGFDERFGHGTFEDNDLCYRMRRAGYRLVIAARSFVHHHGSRTLARLEMNVGALLARNERLYREKWRDDVESGYASALSGLTPEPIVFTPEKHPDRRRRRAQEMARRADISLSMIVKNEERVLADCLASAKPFFKQMIVVDTGSIDRTVEIAREAGAEVHTFPWTDSFAEARNESLKQARGKWVFWLDADDTLPWAAGEAILKAALEAPHAALGFVVPVQFVEDGTAGGASAAGTRVDHVKLFRNLKGLAFEGRIHEQILPALRRASPGGLITRIDAVVLHSGYDTSPEGQQRKRERDYKLLALDLDERPNHPFVLFNFGMTDHFCGEHEKAVDWLQQSIEASEPADSHLRKAYALMAVSLRELGRADKSFEALEKGLRAVGDDVELHFHLASQLSDRARHAEAKDQYLKALACQTADHFSSIDIGLLGFKTFHSLAGVCHALENYRQARDWWSRAIEDAPQFLPSTFSLFDAAREAGDFQTARRMLDRVRAAEGPSESWCRMGVALAESLAGSEGAPRAADEFLTQTLAADPRAVEPRRMLARRLLDAGREAEAMPHLRTLDDFGVAEAPYFLGIMASRRGSFPEALHWMERASELNPAHEETRIQVANLRLVLGPSAQDHEPIGPSVPLQEALRQVASDFGLDAAEVIAYAAEDEAGGYRLPENPLNTADDAALRTTRRWPGGSVWEVEGKLLYALVRALKPETVVEIGSALGWSTSHLAAACLANGQGKVIAVDPALDFRCVEDKLLPWIDPVRQDVFDWTPPREIQFVFEDGSHEPGFTGRVLQRLVPHLAPGAALLCHDFRPQEG